ncbi:hypothetical protein ACFPJ1_40775 [Kribbella qitaiheensis]|uniref:hypothetical protein n=1 Tax=Kribbella qitaiheensis TaxID=1544730 RepID=UPI00361EBE36
MPNFLRRDPAAYATLIQAVLGLALSWGLFGLTETLVPLIMACVNAAIGVGVALYTKRTGFSFAIGLVQATIALMAGYGLELTVDQTTGVIFLSTIVLGFFNWTSNSAAETPSLHEEPMVVPGTVVNQTFATTPEVADALANKADLAGGGF